MLTMKIIIESEYVLYDYVSTIKCVSIINDPIHATVTFIPAINFLEMTIHCRDA